MVSTWMGDHLSVEMDAVGKNTLKSQEWRNGASNKTPQTKTFFFSIVSLQRLADFKRNRAKINVCSVIQRGKKPRRALKGQCHENFFKTETKGC